MEGKIYCEFEYENFELKEKFEIFNNEEEFKKWEKLMNKLSELSNSYFMITFSYTQPIKT